MNRLCSRLTYANVVATLALFVAVAGGTAFAATQLPKNSVGSKQLKKAAVTPAKLSPAAKATLQGAAGAPGPQGPQGQQGAQGPKGDRGETGPATGPAGGALAGSYPDPTLAPGSVATPDFAAGAEAPAAADAAKLGGVLPSGYQERVSGACGGGEAIASIAADGTVTCGPTGSGTITAVTAGTGLTGGGTTGSVAIGVDPSQVQKRVTGACGPGEAVRAVAEDGTVTCQAVAQSLAYTASPAPGAPEVLLGTIDGFALEGRCTSTLTTVAVALAESSTNTFTLTGSFQQADDITNGGAATPTFSDYSFAPHTGSGTIFSTSISNAHSRHVWANFFLTRSDGSVVEIGTRILVDSGLSGDTPTCQISGIATLGA